MKNKFSIGKKIMLGYMALILMTIVLTLLVTSISLSVALRRTTQLELKEQGEALAQLMNKITSESLRDLLDKRILMNNIVSIDQVTDADIYILNDKNGIIYQTSEALSLKQLNNLKSYQNHVFSRTPVLNADGETVASIILVKTNESNIRVKRTTQRVILIALLTASVFGLLIAYFIQRSITKPLKQLTKEVGRIERIDDAKLTQIDSRDEVGNLYDGFDKMLKRLKSTEEERKRFFQNSSHELKTPLMSIQGYAEGIKDGVIEGADIDEALDIIINKSIHLKKTVENLIFLSKLENAEVVHQMEKIDITRELKSWFSHYEKAVDTKGKTLSLEIGQTDSCLIWGDGQELIKVMEILLENAVRYAKRRVTIQLDKRDQGFICIRVIDDGEGIKPSDMDKIFERFYSGAGGKSGLGLSIAKSIINTHKGTITASNDTAGGAVFEVLLPIS